MVDEAGLEEIEMCDAGLAGVELRACKKKCSRFQINGGLRVPNNLPCTAAGDPPYSTSSGGRGDIVFRSEIATRSMKKGPATP